MNNNIYVVGDLHGTIEITKLSVKNWPKQKQFDGSEILVQVGDFGLIWDQRETNEEKYWLDWLSDKPFTTVFIDGNHENFNRLYQFPKTKMFGNDVGVIRDNIFHLQRGNVYTLHNKTFFCFGGASSHDQQWRVNQLSWWPEEMPNLEEMDRGRKSLLDINNEVDYIITHTLPSGIMLRFLNKFNMDPRVDHFTNYLQDIIVNNNVKYKHHYAGHFHVDDTIENTTILNKEIKKIV